MTIVIVLFFSLFSLTEVKALDNKCNCTYSISGEAAGGTSLACVKNGQIIVGQQICDCMLTNYTFSLDSGANYLFGDVWNIEKTKNTSNNTYCQAFDLLFEQYKSDIITIADGGSVDYCKYEKNITTISGVKFNYDIKCTPGSIPPPPAPPAPAPAPVPTQPKLKNGCYCYKNDADIKADNPSSQVINGNEPDCQSLSKTISANICFFFNKGTMINKYVGGVNSKGDTSGETASTPNQPTVGLMSSNDATRAWILDNYDMPPGYTGVIPKCAFSGTCENVNDLLQLGINIGRYVFSIIGSVAFLAFVYGGFTIVFSFGSAEKVKKGTEVLVAAVTGMAIAFGAYMLINFILDALNVTQDFRGIK